MTASNPDRTGMGGPKTAEGKMRSSLNALKHGLTAKSSQAIQAIAAQSEVNYEEILEDLRTHYRPKDPVEEALVRRMASCLARLEYAEAAQRLRALRNPKVILPTSSAERLVKYERIVDLQLHRAIRALAGKREAEQRKSVQIEPYPRSF